MRSTRSTDLQMVPPVRAPHLRQLRRQRRHPLQARAGQRRRRGPQRQRRRLPPHVGEAGPPQPVHQPARALRQGPRAAAGPRAGCSRIGSPTRAPAGRRSRRAAWRSASAAAEISPVPVGPPSRAVAPVPRLRAPRRSRRQARSPRRTSSSSRSRYDFSGGHGNCPRTASSTGEGRALVFTDGHVIEGSGSAPTLDQPAPAPRPRQHPDRAHARADLRRAGPPWWRPDPLGRARRPAVVGLLGAASGRSRSAVAAARGRRRRLRRLRARVPRVRRPRHHASRAWCRPGRASTASSTSAWRPTRSATRRGWRASRSTYRLSDPLG